MSRSNTKTIIDVANQAGVSVSTVSRVLRGVLQVLPETREKVFAAAAKVGYHPNPMARALRTGKSDGIGLIVTTDELLGKLLPATIATLEPILRMQGLRLIVLPVADSDHAVDALNALTGWCCLAIIESRLAPRSDIRAEITIPIIRLGDPGPPLQNDLRLCSIGFDEAGAVASAVRHLLMNGHRNIAFVTGEEEPDSARRKELGFRSALQEAGLPVRPEWILKCARGDLAENARLTFRKAVEASRSRLTAFVCTSDEIALEIISAVRSSEYDVPHHYSVIGYGNTANGQISDPRLTTIEFSGHVLGDTLASRIQAMLYDEAPRRGEHLALPAQLIVRDSTAPRLASMPSRFPSADSALPDGLYEIEAVHSSMMMDVPYCAYGPGSSLWQWTSNGDTSQIWRIQQTSDGWQTIRNVGNWLYLDSNPKVPVVTPAVLNPLRLESPDHQLWQFQVIDQSRRIFRISDKAKSLSLDVAHALILENASVILFPYKASDNQHWIIRPIPFVSGDYELVALHSSMALDVPDESRAPGTVPCQNIRSRSLGQRWRLVHKGRGRYMIQNKLSNLTMSASRLPGNNVTLMPEDIDMVEAQLWLIEPADPAHGSWRLVNQSTGQVLEVSDGSQYHKSSVQAAEPAHTAHQQWLIYEDDL